MTVKLIAVSIGLSVLALASPAVSLDLGTLAEQKACTPDAISLCGKHIPFPGRVKACLLSKRESLRPACRSAIAAYEARTAAPRQ
ncbi:hypothetical protein [Methylobacterium sp. WSM2598]|uniref:hypothetical protein n=1 Tax=Methylobacterium sp. WSM2598 TaxID=398261 RepID=UPI000A059AA9|nr:hypothetical protein [Methylobacterium sp. WSM2598]